MSEVDEHVEKMADLWISFDQDWATFLMCYLLIADKIKEKSNKRSYDRYEKETFIHKPKICPRCNHDVRLCWNKSACDANIRENKLNEQRRA